MTRLSVGISTCPNDTFAFHGLLTGAVQVPGLELDFQLGDVEELNRKLLAGELDVAKASFHAALHLASSCDVLCAGSAVGYGVGPVLLGSPAASAPARSHPSARKQRVLCPGAWTTATLLYRMFHPDPEGAVQLDQVVFSEIMPALAAGEADRGVCIHEGRFTFREHGLELVEDLGERWERETGAPLPLGGILGRRELGSDLLETLSDAIGRSIDHGRGDREGALETMRTHAQEHGDDVLWAHVDLYVSEDTRALSPAGRRSLDELARRAAAAGVVPEGRRLTVVG